MGVDYKVEQLLYHKDSLMPSPCADLMLVHKDGWVEPGIRNQAKGLPSVGVSATRLPYRDKANYKMGWGKICQQNAEVCEVISQDTVEFFPFPEVLAEWRNIM